MTDYAANIPAIDTRHGHGSRQWVVFIATTLPILMMAVGLQLLTLLLLATVVLAIRRVRQRRAAAVLDYVAQAIRLNLPLPAMLRAARTGEGWIVRRRLDHLLELIEDGVPLANALAHAVPEMPPRWRHLLAGAERLGQLPAALDRLVEETRTGSSNRVGSIGFGWIYPIFLPLTLLMVITLIATFVMPKFFQIFLDFNMPLPATVIWFDWFVRSVAPYLLIVIPLLLIAVVVCMTAEIFLGWRIGRLLFRRPVERLMWWLPLAHGAARDRGMADVCRLLGDAVTDGVPLETALNEAARLRINPVLQARLARWREVMAKGEAIGPAARGARLPELLAGTLGAAPGGAVGPSLEFLARYYQGRFSRLRILLEGAWIPTLSVGFGVMVCFVALSIFLPIVRMIDVLSRFTRLM